MKYITRSILFAALGLLNLTCNFATAADKSQPSLKPDPGQTLKLDGAPGQPEKPVLKPEVAVPSKFSIFDKHHVFKLGEISTSLGLKPDSADEFKMLLSSLETDGSWTIISHVVGLSGASHSISLFRPSSQPRIPCVIQITGLHNVSADHFSAFIKNGDSLKFSMAGGGLALSIGAYSHIVADQSQISKATTAFVNAKSTGAGLVTKTAAKPGQ